MSTRTSVLTAKKRLRRSRASNGVSSVTDNIGLSSRKKVGALSESQHPKKPGYTGRKTRTARGNKEKFHAKQEMLSRKLQYVANTFFGWMNTQGNAVSEEHLEYQLDSLKNYYGLKNASIQYQEGRLGIALEINPKLFIPMKQTVISGEKPIPATTNDYLRATHYDGPFNTPIQEIIMDWNKNYGKKIGKVDISDTKLSNSNTSGYTNKSYRPGSVEAVSSVIRGTSRSGAGETPIGHLGQHQQLIMTGKDDANFNGGHLIGDQLLDSHHHFDLYQTWNLAPQHRQFNSPTYSSAFEGPAAKAIDAGNTVKFAAKVQYDSNIQKVSTSTAMSNILHPASYKALQIKNNAALPGTLSFHTRIPRYWSASAEIIKGAGSMSGNIPQSTMSHLRGHNLGPSDKVNFGVGETSIYSICAVAGGKPAYADPKKAHETFSGTHEITLNALQQTYID